jgi:UDP-N-acetylmuramyl pentapeptide phosphotransferase/UDP-N-acetylglucosamine-1-phosphate transferase
LIEALAAGVIAAFLVATLAAWLLVRYAHRLRLVDIPNERSSHTSATPKGGGIAVVIGVAAGVVIFASAGLWPKGQLGSLLAAVAAVAVLGLAADRFSVPPAFRILLQVAVAAATAASVGVIGHLPLPSPLGVPLGWLAWPLTILWLVTVTNFYNFMDGLDGLAGGQAVASCLGIALAAWSMGAQLLSALLAAATLGFLVFNRPPARLFLGDVGSTSLGFAIAAMPLLAPADQRSSAVLAVAIGLSLFLLDPLETLIRLARLGHKFGTAHRQHAYQLLSRTKRDQPRVTGVVVATGFALAICGVMAYRRPDLGWPMMAIGGAAYLVERYLTVRVRPPSADVSPDQSAIRK